MNNLTRSLAVGVLILFFNGLLQAQDTNTDAHDVTVVVPEVALLDIEDGSNITLTITAPTEAGLPVGFSAEDNTQWLNYSSIIGSTTEPNRKVTVVASGNLPAGTNLKVVAGAYTGTGAGTTGSPTAAVTLSTTEQDLITGIGSCYTGDGTSNGHNLTYSIEENMGDYSNLDFDADYTATITYTLSDN